MPLVFRAAPNIAGAVVAICDWCGQPLRRRDLFAWLERETYKGDSEPLAWRRPDGRMVQSDGILFLHGKTCDRQFSEANGRLEAFYNLRDLPDLVAKSFDPDVRAALRLDEPA